MPKADAHTTTQPSSDITLTNFAAALRELEPPGKDGDLKAAQLDRLRGLRSCWQPLATPFELLSEVAE